MSYFKSWKNTSDFPDAWAQPICEWIAKRLQIPTGTKEIVVRNTSRGGHGHAGGRRVFCAVSRRKWRKNWTYSTYPWAKKYMVNNPLEAFVFLAGHELSHVSPEGRRVWNAASISGRHDWRAGMEQRTDAVAWAIVEAYRLEHRGFLRLYASRLRREHKKQKQVRVEKSVKQSPEFRLSRAELLAAAWQAKAERAARAAKKWTVKANRIRAAIGVRDRRMAATPA